MFQLMMTKCVTALGVTLCPNLFPAAVPAKDPLVGQTMGEFLLEPPAVIAAVR